MFDQYASQLIDSLPDLPDLDHVECRRALSLAYHYMLRIRLRQHLNVSERDDARKSLALLRRMSDSLERVAVFDSLAGKKIRQDVRTACAFVAAEAMSLSNDMRRCLTPPADEPNPLVDDMAYSSVEAALLYIIAAYDANAVSAIKDIQAGIPDTTMASPQQGMYGNACHLFRSIASFCRGSISLLSRTSPYEAFTQDVKEYPDVVYEAKALCFSRLSAALFDYTVWLRTVDADDRLVAATDALEDVRLSLSEEQTHLGLVWQSDFADVYHLSSLLLAAIRESSKRAALHGVPRPSEDPKWNKRFERYLSDRICGDEGGRGRPFLWPSALDYVGKCLPGPHADCVVSMPTGSGKGFLAELAVANALAKGWVLYLVPTNALANQVRFDLKKAFRCYDGVDVRAFVGAEEYTSLAEEHVSQQITAVRFVAVMTPEKLSLALRLHPDAFSTCSLCVFDECHLINDGDRGTVVDVSLAQLMELNQDIRFLLMSAMVSNPDDLAGWLAEAHGVESRTATVRWKPTRALRGMLVVDKGSLDSALPGMRKKARALKGRRKQVQFPVSVSMIAGLSGPWTRDGAADYRISPLPFTYQAAMQRKDERVTYHGWKNRASCSLSELFAKNGIPTICFILANKHHAFSLAIGTKSSFTGGRSVDLDRPVAAYLDVSDAELGVPSVLRDLLRRGVAVHTAAMLASEHAASERMFGEAKSPLMFATGTLAQGLNLPAIAVVIAGTTIGNEWNEENDARARSTILNGFGRAGRPGFANQGIVVLATDEPYFAPVYPDAGNVLDDYPVLGEQDASVPVASPVEGFFDKLSEDDDLFITRALPQELQLATLLVESQRESRATEIAKRTYAAYRRRQQLTPEMYSMLEDRLHSINRHFFSQAGIPDWLNSAAMLAGVDFFRIQSMWKTIRSMDMPANGDLGVADWLRLFCNTVSYLHPSSVQGYLADAETKTESPRTRLRDMAATFRFGKDPWKPPIGWLESWYEISSIVSSYMKGHTFVDIARALSPGSTISSARDAQAGIPKVFKFISEVVNPLSIDAGCFLVILEKMFEHGDLDWDSIPEALRALPLCVRNGCDTLGSLAWFRFGYRQRICAHALNIAFPVPDDIASDSDRAAWVRGKRRSWLMDGDPSQDIDLHPLLPAIRTIMQEQE